MAYYKKMYGSRMMPMQVLNNTCETRLGLEFGMCRGDRKLWAVHNFMMWLCWVVFMLVVVCSARYFRHYWRKSIYIHTVFGIITFVITVVAAMMAWGRNWNRTAPGSMINPDYPMGYPADAP